MTEPIAGQHLRSFIERIERLEEDKKNITDDIKQVYDEARGVGFEVKIMKQIVKLRKMEEYEREENEMLLDTYMKALGMVLDTTENEE